MEKKLFYHIVHPYQPHNVNRLQHAEQAGFNQRLAVLFTRGFGSMFAFYILVAWMLIWMVLATAGIWLFAKDAYPFPFLLFCSNLVQLWALPVIMVGQNVLNRHAELQAEEQFQTTQRSYHDIEQIIKHLDEQDRELLKQTEILLKLHETERK